MKNNRSAILWLTQGAAIAALYVVLTVVFAPISFGAIQVRIAEALTILPLFTPAAIPASFSAASSATCGAEPSPWTWCSAVWPL